MTTESNKPNEPKPAKQRTPAQISRTKMRRLGRRLHIAAHQTFAVAGAVQLLVDERPPADKARTERIALAKSLRTTAKLLIDVINALEAAEVQS